MSKEVETEPSKAVGPFPVQKYHSLLLINNYLIQSVDLQNKNIQFLTSLKSLSYV